jgi:hypothetical protein
MIDTGSRASPPTSFERFEYKYWVPELVAEELLLFSEPYLRRDELAGRSQRNTSLYLDSSDNEFVQMHVESQPDRLKLRVRAYGEPPRGPAFFEIKRKVKAVTLKRRAIVPMELVGPILRGEVTEVRLRSAEEERTLGHFLYLMAVHRAEPRALVTCRREAYSSIEPSEGVRLTLDRDICYQRACSPSLDGDPAAWVRLCGIGTYEAAASTLIELKFRGTAPWWVDELVQRLSLRASSYSKYVSAMAHDELGPGGEGGVDLMPTPAARAARRG